MVLWLFLAILTAAGLAAVLQPLFGAKHVAEERSAFDAEVYRDQLKQVEIERENGLLEETEAEAARTEVSRRLLAAASQNEAADTPQSRTRVQKLVTVVVLLAVPVGSMGLYLKLGSPDLPSNPFAARQSDQLEDQNLAALIVQAEEHLRQTPDDVRGWRVLAPAYMQEQRFADAANAYRQVILLGGMDAEVLTNYGEALVLAQGGMITETARQAFDDTLALDPASHRARFYLALADRQDGKHLEAIAAWEQILAEAPDGADYVQFIQAHIDAARQSIGSAPELSDEQLQDAEGMSREEQLTMIEGMVSGLAARLDDDGSDLEGWFRLINAYAMLGRPEDAATALDRARGIFEGNEDVLVQFDDIARQLGLEQQ
jgi:cytochrome c-type biogenesis protein CcmH